MTARKNGKRDKLNYRRSLPNYRLESDREKTPVSSAFVLDLADAV
ncbi:MAG TPA: hypothetical protein VGB26_06685 [Nitrospiria bacterium]|jgi:hypothetical protein